MDRLSAKVKIMTFSPTENKIRIMATIPRLKDEDFDVWKKRGKEEMKRFHNLASWKVINDRAPSRFDLESKHPIKDYKILVNPSVRTNREDDMGEKSGRVSFWLNSEEGPSQVPTNMRCDWKKGSCKDRIPCFELRNENMICNFYDKSLFEDDGASFTIGEASVYCFTDQE